MCILFAKECTLNLSQGEEIKGEEIKGEIKGEEVCAWTSGSSNIWTGVTETVISSIILTNQLLVYDTVTY